MICPNCGAEMKVGHTYKICGQAHTSRHTCGKCNRVCTSITLMVFDEPERGQGAYSVSKKARQKHIEEIRKAAKTVIAS